MPLTQAHSATCGRALSARPGACGKLLQPPRRLGQPSDGARGRTLQVTRSQARPFGGGSSQSPDGRQQLPSAAVASQAPAAAHIAPPAVATSQPAPPVAQQEQQLTALVTQLGRAATYGDKMAILLTLPAVRSFFNATREGLLLSRHLRHLPPKDAFCLVCLPAIHQQHVLSLIPAGAALASTLGQLGTALARVEDFYDSIGGLAGYQLQCLHLIAQHHQEQQQEQQRASSSSDGSMSSGDDWASAAEGAAADAAAAGGRQTQFLVPSGLDLASPALQQQAAAAVAAGIAALPAMAEVYPLGGAGDRLGLRCEQSGDSLPTAVLQYCGRSLLENLVRDLQAREYLYWKLHGVQHTTPVAIMTSAAKGNHWRVQQLFEQSAWFGRGEARFRLFQQPLVPMVAAHDGRWLLSEPLKVLMKPGGHGVIWKLMIDTGVFGWLAAQGRQAAIVRQISNPMAGMDNTLLALSGAGFPARRSFGFASCERVVGAAEGMNVLAQEEIANPASASAGAPPHYSYRITNVEYTEFERLGITDASVDEASNFSVFPANTNVLYVGLKAVESAVRASMAAGATDAVLPGMILNLGKKVSFADPLARGEQRSLAAGRLECTMQNLADCLSQSFQSPLESCEDKAGLDTFLVYNQRRKVTSSAKRKLKAGSTRVHQTPDGSFYDLQHNAHEMLTAHCGMQVPEIGSVSDYLAAGPSFVFLYQPALGPLWQVVGQKVRGGSLAPHSEVQLEVAEACLREVHVRGSLLVQADAALGHTEQQRPAAAAAASGSAAMLDSLMGATNSSGSSSSEPSGSSTHHLDGSSSGDGHHVNLNSGLSANTTRMNGTGAGSSSGTRLAAHEAAEPRLVFSHRCGRLRLHNVTVTNRGVDWQHPGNVWWRHSLARHETCRIVLHGMSEFEAQDVTLSGDLTFEVPDGHRMLVTAGGEGAPAVQLLPLAQPTWQWQYSMAPGSGEVQLDLLESSSKSSSEGGSINSIVSAASASSTAASCRAA